MALKFEVEGPFEVPFTRGKMGRLIRSEDARSFWRSNPKFAERRGCYVFCIRNAGLTVAYVGKASRDFESEVFTPHKLIKYHESLVNCAKGSPVLFFVLTPSQRGAVNHAAIEECEDWLIWFAKRANPEVQNDRGGAAAPFEIPHVSDPGRGRPSHAALDLCRALDIVSPSVVNRARRARSGERPTEPLSEAPAVSEPAIAEAI